jgi:hypothetical protein
MATTTPFLDLEHLLFGRDHAELDRVASQYVLTSAAAVARRRVTTARYRAVTPRPPTCSDGATTVVRCNDPALVLASRVHAA